MRGRVWYNDSIMRMNMEIKEVYMKTKSAVLLILSLVACQMAMNLFLWIFTNLFDSMIWPAEGGVRMFRFYSVMTLVSLSLAYLILRRIPMKGFRLAFYGILVGSWTVYEIVDIALNPDLVSDNMPYAWLGGVLVCGIFMILEAKDRMSGRRRAL